MTYTCDACGATGGAFVLRCPSCGAWRSITRVPDRAAMRPPVPLAQVSLEPELRRRCNIPAVDELLGGGLVPGSAVLLSGPPGAGKSTIVLQILSGAGESALYATGEESLGQLRRRAERIGALAPRLLVTDETDLNIILPQAREAGVALLVVDSLQTSRVGRSGSAPGSPTQMRDGVTLLRAGARECGYTLLLIGQVTKGGATAGPRTVEHAVDVVLSVSCDPGAARTLRSVKNRFGPVDRVCRFDLGERGAAFDAA